MKDYQPALPVCWRQETKPHKFCPGCGHGAVLKALGFAIDELGLQDRVLLCVDIGCSLLAVDFFDFDTVQTHHGRTVPVAVGLKRAAPGKLVLAYMGDGGAYAIGMQHLVSAAMRNDKITAIVVNNTNYGMTGGQLAPTTLVGQTTETSPWGRDEATQGTPLHGPEMLAVAAGRGSYLARGTVAAPARLGHYLKRALETQRDNSGLSLVEALSPCPVNWKTDAAATRAFLENEMARTFPVGEFKVPLPGGTRHE